MTTPLIEAIARAMWDVRETTFPPQTRMAWERGTQLARDVALKHAAAMVAAIAEQDMVIVPREPTQDMIIAGIIERHDQPTPEAWSLATENIYRAMISAAQGDGA